MKKILTLLLAFISVFSFSQVGIGTNTPNANAVLELSSTTQGMKFPRLTTSQRGNIALPAKGLTVFDTEINCLMTNFGTPSVPVWKCIGGLPIAVVSAYSCSTASAGNMTAGVAVSGVTQTITANVTTVGTYNISAIANGVTFTGTGTFSGTGAQDIVLTATGIPTAATASPYSYTLNTTPTCSFTRAVINQPSSNGTAVVSAYSCSTASAGNMTAGVAVSGVTQTITATVTSVGTYSISTTANGVTFAGSGTFVGSGSQAIVLTATGTPTYGTTNAFVLNTTPNCSFDRTTLGNASSNGTAVVSAYTCTTASAGTMVVGDAVSGVTQTITATVTTVGTYSISTTANGVTFSGTGTFAGTASQNIVLTATGTPTAAGSNTFTLNTTPNCNFTRVTSGIVTSTTGKIWLDRNLGATQVATSSTDHLSYGDLYQWGRGADGHQTIVWTSSTTSNGAEQSNETATLSVTDTPGNANFINSSSDWRSSPNVNLWQGVSGINNPCPSGFRIPTEVELNAERTSWGSNNNAADAFASPLKLPMPGGRDVIGGTLSNTGTFASYWSSTVNGTVSRRLSFDNSVASMSDINRGSGRSVRCIKGDATSGGTAVVSAYDCSTASAGTMSAGTAVSGVTQTITATVTTVGTYSISAIANGVTFSGSGTFAGTGSRNIVLTATGTPTTAGNTTFTLNTTPNCGFDRVINQASSNGTAVVSAYTCTTASAGTMVAGDAVSGVTQTITATVTTVGTYSISAIANGVTFSGSGTFAGTGAQNIVLTATGTPTAAGSNTFTLNTTPNCNFSRVTSGTVTSSTGKIWLDRNLGATQVAASSTDVNSYGDLYQWGRGADGHQIRTPLSAQTTGQSTSTTPGSSFIFGSSNWYSGTNPDLLWQGVSGTNNPCPSGYRLPTEAEWQAERNNGGTGFWGTGRLQNNATGAFASPLKLPMLGHRYVSNGALAEVGTDGFYWSSTVSGTISRRLYFWSSDANVDSYNRAGGGAVRCLKE